MVAPFWLAAAGAVLIGFNLRVANSEIPPVLPDLGLGDAAKSLLVTIPLFCFSLAAFASPPLRARLGEERGLFAMLAALCIGLALRPAWGVWSLFAGTIVCGLAIAVMNVLMPSVVRRRFPRRIGEMFAAYTMSLSIGSGLAAGLTIPIARAFGSIPWALAVWAVPALVALVVWSPQLRWKKPAREAGAMRLGLLRDRLAWQITFYFGFQSMVWYALLSWLPAIYRDKGADPATAGALLGVLSTVGIVGNFAAPMAASRLRDKRWVVAVSSLLTIVGVSGVLLAPTSTALLFVIILGIATSGSFSMALLLMASQTRDATFAARLSGMAQGFGYLISAGGPLLAGLLHAASGGWQLPLLLIIALSVGALVAGVTAARSREVVEPADLL